MIFHNPAGAPELACDACGCRWFDRMRGTCYECGAEVTEAAQEEFRQALAAFAGRQPEGSPTGVEPAPDIGPHTAQGSRR